MNLRIAAASALLAALLAGPAVLAGLPALPSEGEALPTDSSQVIEVEPLVAWDKAYPGEDLRAALRVRIRSGFHINPTRPTLDYLKPTTIRATAPEGITVGDWTFPKPERRKFAFSETAIDVYEGEIIIRSVLRVAANALPGTRVVKVALGVQACNDENCLRPGTAEIEIPVEVAAAGTGRVARHSAVFSEPPAPAPPAPPVPSPGTAAPVDSGEDSLGRMVRERGYFSFFLAVFVGGLLLTFTPCVYPVIPITIGYFGGQSEGRMGRTFLLSVLYVLGMAITYSTLGAIAGLTGGMLGQVLQHPATSVFLSLVMIALALSQFGLYEFRVPGATGGAFRARVGPLGALFMGLVVGLVAAPCLGPFVLGVLTHVARAGSWSYGFLVFFVLSLGLGTPFLLLGMASGSIRQLPRAGEWMEWVKKLFGVALLGMAIYFLRFLPFFPSQGRWILYLLLAAAAAAYLGFLTRSGDGNPRFRTFKRVFAVAGLLVVALLVVPWRSEAGGLEWRAYSEEAVLAAKEAGRPVMIDFGAEWCIPCKEMEEKTFRDPRVAEVLRGFVLLKVDMTSETPATEALADKYQIPGVPQVVFLDGTGREARGARVGSYLGPEQFLKKLEAVPR